MNELAGLRAESVEPLFFPAGKGDLYACHHLPVGPARGEAVLLCAPAGHEYSRSHRALRQLAAQFAKAGYHAFRFDYYGTGDSAGLYEDADPALWRDDVAAAIELCRQRAGVASVGLVGARLGASLALQAAQGRRDVPWLVLWSPVLDGAGLVAEWRAEHKAVMQGFGQTVGEAEGEILGFPFSGRMASGLAGLDLLASPPAGLAVGRTLLLHPPEEAAGATRLAAGLTAAAVAVDCRAFEQGAVWRQETLEPIVPFAALRGMVDWVEGRA